MDLENIAKELRIILDEKRLELGLEFFEDEHKYLMKDVSGVVKDNFPSVSKVLKKFYKEFPTDEAAYNKAKGDLVYAEQLKKEWAQAGFESTNLGSRTHFFLMKFQKLACKLGILEMIFNYSKLLKIKHFL